MLLGLHAEGDVFDLTLEFLYEEVFQNALVLVGLAALRHVEGAPGAIYLVERRVGTRWCGGGKEIDNEQFERYTI